MLKLSSGGSEITTTEQDYTLTCTVEGKVSTATLQSTP